MARVFANLAGIGMVELLDGIPKGKPGEIIRYEPLRNPSLLARIIDRGAARVQTIKETFAEGMR